VEKKGPSAVADLVAGVLSVCLFVVNIIVDVNEPTWLTVSSLVCLALAVPFAAIPFLHLAKFGKPKPADAFYVTTRVADRGVYAMVRHPQYLGYMFLVVGFAGLDPHPVALAVAGAAVAFFYLQCVLEERFCREVFGEDYNHYVMRVPRVNFLLGLYRIASRHFTNV
jgi:protein-S-isoprenylcysteine O-methyltransferase Ste14